MTLRRASDPGHRTALEIWSNGSSTRLSNRNGRYLIHNDLLKDRFYPLFDKLAAKWKQEGRNEPLKPFNWHALQNFAISCWIEAGLPPKTIQTFADPQQLAGHDGPLWPSLSLG